MKKAGFGNDVKRILKLFGTAIKTRFGILKFSALAAGLILAVSAIVAGAAAAFNIASNTDKNQKLLQETNQKATVLISSTEKESEPPNSSETQNTYDKTETITDKAENLINVIILCDGEEKAYEVAALTVEEAVKISGCGAKETDFLLPSAQTQIYNGIVITVLRTEQEQVEYYVDIPFETEYIETAELYEGETRLLQEGQCGKKKIVLLQTLLDGKMAESQTLFTEELSEPVKQIVQKGTKQKTVPTTTKATTKATTKTTTKATTKTTTKATTKSTTKTTTKATTKTTTVATTPAEPPVYDGETLTIGGVVYAVENRIEGRAVAYYSTKPNPLTYTGNPAIPGKTVAVDPGVIPLGSIVYVVAMDGTTWSYGPAYAHDIGGGIKGNYVDLFMASYADCVAHGNRNCLIYVLSPTQ